MAEPTEPAPALDPADIRWKMAVACDICRRRKVRCDGERPCSRCAKGSITCTFSLPKHVSRKSDAPPRKRRSHSGTSSQPEAKRRGVAKDPSASSKRAPASPSGSSVSPPLDKDIQQQLLLIDPDDQIVYSGPSSGMPLFARLGLLRTVEVVEGNTARLGGSGPGQFSSHSSGALGLTSALTNTRDYFDLCLSKCPQDRMLLLLGHHLHSPVFFPLLHAPSLLAEFIAVAEGRLRCTAPYAALLMSILAVTAKLVDAVKPLLPEHDRGGETYYHFAQDLLRVSANKLDIRHILALYHLSVYVEGRTSAAGETSSFVTEAIGLAFTTGLHRSTREFNMDPVTLQLRTRLFWALYSMDIAMAYSQGRPALIPLQECSIEFPAMVENSRITKSEIFPQPEDEPAVGMSAAITTLKIYMILEQVLSSINAPSTTIAQQYSLDSTLPRRASRLKRAVVRLDEIEESLPDYLNYPDAPEDTTKSMNFIMSCRIRCTLLFTRTLIARQLLIDEFESAPAPTAASPSDRTTTSAVPTATAPAPAPGKPTATPSPSDATVRACRLSVDIVTTCRKLFRRGFLQHCSFTTVSHLLAAGHTLIACMARSAVLRQQHRPHLMTCVEMLASMDGRFPCAGPAARLLVQLARTMDLGGGGGGRALEDEGFGGVGVGIGATDSEALAIRVLARKMAKSPSSTGHRPLPGTPSSHPSHRDSTTSTPTAPTPTPYAGPPGTGAGGPAPPAGSSSGFSPKPPTAPHLPPHPDLARPPPLHPHPNAPSAYDDAWLVRVTGLRRPVQIPSAVRHARLNGQLSWARPVPGGDEPAVVKAETEEVGDEAYGGMQRAAAGDVAVAVAVGRVADGDRGEEHELRRQTDEYDARVRGVYGAQQANEQESHMERKREVEMERQTEKEREKEILRRALADTEAPALRIGREWGERGEKPHQQLHQHQVPSLPAPAPGHSHSQAQVSPPFPALPPPHHTPQQQQHIQHRLPPPHHLPSYPLQTHGHPYPGHSLSTSPHPPAAHTAPSHSHSHSHTPHVHHHRLPSPLAPPHHVSTQHTAYAQPPHQQYHNSESVHTQHLSLSPVQGFPSLGTGSSVGNVAMGMPVDVPAAGGASGFELGMNEMGSNRGAVTHGQHMTMAVDGGTFNLSADELGQAQEQAHARGHGNGPTGLLASLAGPPMLWEMPPGGGAGDGVEIGMGMEMGGAGGMTSGHGMGGASDPGLPMTQTPVVGVLTGVGLLSGSIEWNNSFSFLNDGLFGTL